MYYPYLRLFKIQKIQKILNEPKERGDRVERGGGKPDKEKIRTNHII
jgi:hypothetical protein